ncbi:MAG: hypothetical protein ACD_3C00145G0016 [uncultured bacterium (gcode 4)]|uniref:Uncharacterized protein n=1 Tax=uncultured bacterium (gcode 4) TaxID=1234023 RepID=K2GWT8_9BACT|nr:MAG: hypothetical protein ACD_3C00145G0016 [uncultured bacterium (gcode 4)]
MNLMPWSNNDSNVLPWFQFNWSIYTPWIQTDWSIMDVEWKIIHREERDQIIKSIYDLPFHNKSAGDKTKEIIDSVHSELITVINGKTWSGKTTETPKLFLWKGLKVVISEPRIIAALNACEFTCTGLFATTGDPYYSIWHKVWYRTWKETKSSNFSELLYVTDWLQLLRQFFTWINPDILIMDELHTYSVPTEFLLKMMKDFIFEQLKKNVKDRTKLVLMSATIDYELITEYFKDISTKIPLIKIEWRPHKLTREYISGWEFLYSIINQAKNKKNVLAFVEWKKTIEGTMEELRLHLNDEEYEILPLHSELPIDEQKRLMQKHWDKTVVIIATNVARESLTIPYINSVVDNWLKKSLKVNSKTWVPELRVEVISKAEADQWAGRAGRIGEWLWIFANDTKYEDLPDFPSWEIEDVTLERYILLSLSIWKDLMKELKWELAKDESERKRIFIHEPNIDLIQLSYDNLLKIWAIWEDHVPTKLGRELLTLPLDPFVWKMLKASFKLDCSGDMIDICSIISHKWFLGKNESWKEFVLKKYKRNSDLIAQREMFKFITTREPLKDTDIAKLIEFWVNKQELNLFKEYAMNWKEKMLFELVDLTSIWVKQKKILEILGTIDILKVRLENSWHEINYHNNKDKKNQSKHFENIVKSILHGIPNNLFEYMEDANIFHNKGMGDFIKPKTSVIFADEKHRYVWLPFIIWWVDGNEDTPLLLFVSKVDESMLNEVIYTHTDGEFKDLNQVFDKKAEITKKKWRSFTPRELDDLQDDFGWMNIIDLINDIPKEKLRDINSFLWLPEYLVKNNYGVKKLIKSYSWTDKWEFNIVRFTKLLAIFLPRLIKRFYMEDIPKTLTFYKDDKNYLVDTIILSKDPRIVEFLANPYKKHYDTPIWSSQNRRMSDTDKQRFEEIWEAYERHVQLEKKIEKSRKWGKSIKLNLHISKMLKVSKVDAKLLIDNQLIRVNGKNTFYLQSYNPRKDDLVLLFNKAEMNDILKALKAKDDLKLVGVFDLKEYISLLFEIPIEDADLLIENNKIKVNWALAVNEQIFDAEKDELNTYFEKDKLKEFIDRLKRKWKSEGNEPVWEISIESDQLDAYISTKYKISKDDAKLLIENDYIIVNDKDTSCSQSFDSQNDSLELRFRKDELLEILKSIKEKE